MKRLTEKCDEMICKRYPTSTKILKRAGYILKQILVIIVIFIMTLIQVQLEPTLINSVFLILSFTLLYIALASDNSEYKCAWIAYIMKIYAAIIIITSVFYHLITNKAAFGFDIKEWLKQYAYTFYFNLDIIGLG